MHCHSLGHGHGLAAQYGGAMMLHHLCCDEWLFASVVLSEPLSKRNCYTDVVCFTYGVSTQFLVLW
jgi:hypothetical protein